MCRPRGWPVARVKSRRARACKLLRRRLARRGIPLTAALIGAAQAETASAAVPDLLVDSTIETVMRLAAGKTVGLAWSPAVMLAEDMLEEMLKPPFFTLAQDRHPARSTGRECVDVDPR